MTTIADTEETTVEVIPSQPSMQFTVNQKALVDALTAIAPAISKRSTLPILSNVKIAASTLGVKVSATNLDIYASARLPLSLTTIQRDGACTTNHKVLLALVKPLKNQELTFTYQDGSLTVETGSLTVALETMPADEYPIEPHRTEKGEWWPQKQTITLPVTTFRQMVTLVEYAANTDYSRSPVLTSIRVKLSQDTLDMAAADKHRMGIMREKIEGAGSWNFDLLIPAVSLRDMLKKCPKEGDLTLSAESAIYASITCGSLTAHMRLVEGTFPNVEMIIPKDADTVATVQVDVLALKNALETVASIAKDSSNITRLHLLNGGLEVKAQRGGMEKPMVVKVPAQTTGAEMEFWFNWQHLMDVIQAHSHGSLSFALQGAEKPAKVTIPELPGFIGVTMPMRLNH